MGPVIAPLEHEVALEVCEYLTQMFDAKLQEKKPPKERIICDVLYDSTVKPTAQDKKKLSPSPLKEWLGTEYCENGRNTIPKENLSVAVTEVWSHWGQDKEGVCRVLGELCSNVFRWSIEDCYRSWQSIFCTVRSKNGTRRCFGCTTMNNAHSAVYNWIFPDILKTQPSGTLCFKKPWRVFKST